MVDEMRTHGKSLLTTWGNNFKKRVVKKLPKWLSTRVLTLTNLISAVLTFIAYLVQDLILLIYG